MAFIGVSSENTTDLYHKVLPWVLSFGSGARPVEPPELAEEWEEHILELYEMVKPEEA